MSEILLPIPVVDKDEQLAEIGAAGFDKICPLISSTYALMPCLGSACMLYTAADTTGGLVEYGCAFDLLAQEGKVQV